VIRGSADLPKGVLLKYANLLEQRKAAQALVDVSKGAKPLILAGPIPGAPEARLICLSGSD
jgi:hypothetical protein